jgi:hypothetical protein
VTSRYYRAASPSGRSPLLVAILTSCPGNSSQKAVVPDPSTGPSLLSVCPGVESNRQLELDAEYSTEFVPEVGAKLRSSVEDDILRGCTVTVHVLYNTYKWAASLAVVVLWQGIEVLCLQRRSMTTYAVSSLY